jgi:hypothetical protein
MILGKPKGRSNYTCSLSDKYYENQCKNPPEYYTVFEFEQVSDDYVFKPDLKKYDKLEKVCYLFHHRLVQYYIEHDLDPDTPWWWYDNAELHTLANRLANKIKDTL